jgi:hypothetical protein
MGLSAFCVHAQEGALFAYRSNLDTVRKTAFYKIPLSPELVAKSSRGDLADLRIRDAEGRFIPYVLKEDEAGKGSGMGEYQDLPDPVIQQKDSSNRHSYIILQYGEAYRIDKLTLDVRSPVLYKRTARVYATEPDPAVPVISVSIDPGNNVFRIPTVKTRRLMIDIANADNPSLVISRVGTAQRMQYLLTYLQEGLSYQLLAGNAQAGPPEYDLKYFVDSLSREPLVLLAGSPQPAGSFAPARAPASVGGEQGAHGGDHSGILLWSIITLVLLLLIYLSVKLARATVRKDANNRL